MANEVSLFSPQQGALDFAAAAKRMMRPNLTGGTDMLLFKKHGDWSMGAEGTVPDPDGEWIVDATSMMSGWIAWANGQATERMAGIGMEPVDPADLPPAPAGSERGWEPAFGAGLVCVGGEDEGRKVVFKTNSDGGSRAWQSLLDAMMVQVAQGLPHHPVVMLGSDSYPHKKYGKIYKPVFDIIGWANDAGEVTYLTDGDIELIEAPAPEPEPTPEPEPAPEPTTRTRRTRRA